MTQRFEDSYLGQLRALVGNRTLIAPGVRAIVRDDAGRILLVRRSDTGAWVMPAGSMELGESVWDCLVREVWEETALDVTEATMIALYSAPRFAFTNAYGGQHQMVSFVFCVDAWAGDLQTRTETVDARFFPHDALPTIPDLYRETLDDLNRYDGRLILK